MHYLLSVGPIFQKLIKFVVLAVNGSNNPRQVIMTLQRPSSV